MFQSGIKKAVLVAFVTVFGSCITGQVSADSLRTIDDLEFGESLNTGLFSRKTVVKSEGESDLGKLGMFNTFFEAEELASDSSVSTLDDLNFSTNASEYSLSNSNQYGINQRSKGFKINRAKAALETDKGILTVGDDWTNFRDFIKPEKSFTEKDFSLSTSTNSDTTLSGQQISWTTPTGFSLALENMNSDSEYENSRFSAFQSKRYQRLMKRYGENTSLQPGLVLSWNGGPGGKAGRYRIAALRRVIKLQGNVRGRNIDADTVGWGLNVEGGWQFGDLFASLSVTVGEGIDSYILNSPESDLFISRSGNVEAIESMSISPSLTYSLSNRSNIHFSVQHYESENAFKTHGIDTLDTIHLGYSWSPWPSTRFGVELVGKDAEGRRDVTDSTQLNFGAQKQF